MASNPQKSLTTCNVDLRTISSVSQEDLSEAKSQNIHQLKELYDNKRKQGVTAALEERVKPNFLQVPPALVNIEKASMQTVNNSGNSVKSWSQNSEDYDDIMLETSRDNDYEKCSDLDKSFIMDKPPKLVVKNTKLLKKFLDNKVVEIPVSIIKHSRNLVEDLHYEGIFDVADNRPPERMQRVRNKDYLNQRKHKSSKYVHGDYHKKKILIKLPAFGTSKKVPVWNVECKHFIKNRELDGQRRSSYFHLRRPSLLGDEKVSNKALDIFEPDPHMNVAILNIHLDKPINNDLKVDFDVNQASGVPRYDWIFEPNGRYPELHHIDTIYDPNNEHILENVSEDSEE